jgi:WD40 repeat protein
MGRSLFKGAQRVTISLLFGAVPLLGQHHVGHSSVRAAEVLSVTPENLAGRFPGILAFDVSPDGQMLAVEFITANDQNNQVIQVAEWDIASKKLKTTKVVEGPAKQLMSNPQFQYDLKFTPDGLDLVALTGPRVVVLSAQTLALQHVIGLPAEPGPPPPFGRVLNGFAISQDGTKLAVTSRGVGPTCGDHSTVRLFDLPRLGPAGTWVFHGCGGLQLSPDGSLALLGWRPNQVEGIRGALVESATGRILRSFPGGGGIFLDDTRFITGLHYPSNPGPSDEAQATLGVVSVGSGKVEHEMRYGHYGVGGNIAVAPSGGIVAVMESWLNPKDLARDATNARGFVRLILFRASDTEPFYVSPDIHDRPMFGSVYMARLSSDGRVVAYGGSTIHVLKITYDSADGSSVRGSATEP